MRNRCLKPPNEPPAGTWRIGWLRRVWAPHFGPGTSWPGVANGPGGHGEVLRGNRGDAAGVRPGASSSKRSSSEHGNRFVPVRARTAGAAVRLGPPSTDRDGTGRSRRSSPRPGKPVTWPRAAARSAGKGRQCPKDTEVNTSVVRLDGEEAESRVWRMQTKLHQWAAADLGRRFDDLHNLVFDPATLQVAFAGRGQ